MIHHPRKGWLFLHWPTSAATVRVNADTCHHGLVLSEEGCFLETVSDERVVEIPLFHLSTSKKRHSMTKKGYSPVSHIEEIEILSKP